LASRIGINTVNGRTQETFRVQTKLGARGEALRGGGHAKNDEFTEGGNVKEEGRVGGQKKARKLQLSRKKKHYRRRRLNDERGEGGTLKDRLADSLFPEVRERAQGEAGPREARGKVRGTKQMD